MNWEDWGNLTAEDDYTLEIRINHEDGNSYVRLVPDMGKWYEGRVVEGTEPYGWGGKTYQGYLTGNEILNWLRRDYYDAEIVDATR